MLDNENIDLGHVILLRVSGWANSLKDPSREYFIQTNTPLSQLRSHIQAIRAKYKLDWVCEDLYDDYLPNELLTQLREEFSGEALIGLEPEGRLWRERWVYFILWLLEMNYPGFEYEVIQRPQFPEILIGGYGIPS